MAHFNGDNYLPKDKFSGVSWGEDVVQFAKLHSLSRRQAEMLFLCYDEDLDMDKVSERAGISLNTVANHMAIVRIKIDTKSNARAVNKLAKFMLNYQGTGGATQ